MPVRKWFVALTGFVALSIVSGCSKDSSSLATVSGVVTQNSVPLADAKVTFISTVESEGKRAAFSAVTDSSGKYLIATVGKEPGIPPGMYKVTITKFEAKSNQSEMDAGQVAASGTGRNAVSQEYESEYTTKLSVTLESGKNENKNFDVKPNTSTGSGKSTGGLPIP